MAVSLRRLAVAGAALALALPAAAASGSGLFGMVRKGPVTPVCRAEVPCTKPAAGVVLVFTSSSGSTARVMTATDGSFRVVLAAGRYTVRVRSAARFGSSVKPGSATVEAGRFMRRNFMIDTGIR
jgi:hypothetical protein